MLTTCAQSCGQTEGRSDINTYNEFRTQQLEHRDSALVIYTIKQWHDSNWYVYEDVSLMYRSSNDNISYFIGGAFYSPDKLKMIVWVGEKEPNAATIEKYNKEKPQANRICPQGGDTVYHMTALIGFRKDTTDTWNLYPLNNILASCYDTREEVINVMGQYYFREMKHHSMYVVNYDEYYGGAIIKGKEYNEYLQEYDKFYLKEYGYNLQEKDFWDKNLLWQKGANIPGLYNFQTKGNVTPDKKNVERIRPNIVYPEEILKLYR